MGHDAKLEYRFPVLFANKRSCPKDALYGIWAQSTVQLQRKFRLTLSAWQTKTNAYANSVDPDETARTHQDLHSLSFGSKSLISDIQMYLIATTNNSLFCWTIVLTSHNKNRDGGGGGDHKFSTLNCLLHIVEQSSGECSSDGDALALAFCCVFLNKQLWYQVHCLCWGFTAQSTQWAHVECDQFT